MSRGKIVPGIAGIIEKKFRSCETRARELEKMIRCMMHEPFYNSSTYINERQGFYIGSVSLDRTFSDCMPIFNETNDLVLFFSGECFIDQGSINHIKGKGHEFNPLNASYLIHLFEEKGESFIEELNGWFSGILLDIKKTKALLFNDRYGLQRIYYHENEDCFLFSSEAKSLLKVMPSLRAFDLKSLSDYFVFDSVLEDRTFFSKIYRLPSGSAWKLSNGEFIKGSYFNTNKWENQPVLEKEDFFHKIIETFENVLPRYLTGDHVGMSLTGGLDTRMILSCLNPNAHELPCYTFGGMYRDSLDVHIARQIAEACKQTHHTLQIDKGYLAELPSYAEKTVFITDGLADICKSQEIFLNKMVRDIAMIRLTGKYGSQVFRGVSLLRDRSPDGRIFDNGFKEYIHSSKKQLNAVDKRNHLSFILFNEIPWCWAGVLAAELSQLTVRSPYLDNDLVSLLYQAPIGILDNSELQVRVIKKTNPRLSLIRTNRGFYGSSFSILAKISLLGYKFINDADNLYNWEKMPHWLARLDYLLAPFHLEKLILGFDQWYHYRIWFRNELSYYVQEIILDNKTLNRPYFNKRFLTKIVHNHINGYGNYTGELKKIITSELIHRLLIENI